MHILMTGDTIGGVWQYVLDLARECCARGHVVTIAALGAAPSADQLKAARTIDGCRLVALDLPLEWTAPSPATALEAGASLARFAREIGAELVHLHSPVFAAGGGFAAPVVAVCHSCVATWWDAVGMGPLPADLAWRRDLTDEGCRRVDALLAPTATFAAETARVHDLPRVPTVVRNGRRQRPGGGPTPDSASFVFTAGRLWDRAKNMDTVDRVAERLSIPVLAAGSLRGPNGERITLNHVDLLGRLSDEAIARHLDRRPIFLSLARYEPFGLAVLEAAQAGCALVLSDIPTFRELWGEAAVFVDPDDEGEGREAIEALAADPERRAALGEAARVRAERYSAEAMADGVLAVFHAVLTPRRLVPRSLASIDGAA